MDGRLGNLFERTLKSGFIQSPLSGGGKLGVLFGGVPYLVEFFLDVGVDLVGDLVGLVGFFWAKELVK